MQTIQGYSCFLSCLTIVLNLFEKLGLNLFLLDHSQNGIHGCSIWKISDEIEHFFSKQAGYLTVDKSS